MTMTMKNPPHPGLSVRHDCIEPLGLTVTEAAEALGVTRQTLNNLVNGKSGISADMAIRLDKAFGGGAETWLRLQMAYDLAQARRHQAVLNVPPGAQARFNDQADGRAQAARTAPVMAQALRRAAPLHRDRQKCWITAAQR